jgi:hypothetical protein
VGCTYRGESGKEIGASLCSLFPRFVRVKMCSFVCSSGLPQAVCFIFVPCAQV